MENLKSYDLMVEHELDIDALPERIVNKVNMMEELMDKYEEEKDEDMQNELKMRIESCDKGLYADVVQYLKQENKDEDKGDEKDEGATNKIQQNNSPNNTMIEGKPSWRFWM